MKKTAAITHLFIDIGGVLLTNGWDHRARKQAAMYFKLKWAEVEEKHQQIFQAFEEGRFTLEEYLNLVIFTQERPFTQDQFKHFMYAQSKPDLKMLALIRRLKKLYGVKIFVLSNEAKELNVYRIHTFKLDDFVDAFISSCFVHIRKPDPEIFQLALDISQASPKQVAYIENTSMFVQIADRLGIASILHTDYKSTCDRLASLGLHAD